MTKRSMRAARMIAAAGLCACMAAGMVACDGVEGADGAGEQATEETSAEDGSSDGSADSAPDGGEAASDAASAGEGEGSQQEGSSGGQDASSDGSDSGSSVSAGSSDSGSSQKASASSNSGASASSAKASGSTSAQASAASATASSAPAHTHSYTIPVTTQVWHDDVYKSVTWCNLCQCEADTAHCEADIDAFLANGCTGTVPSTSVKRILVSAGYYETVTTGYKCSCGAVK